MTDKNPVGRLARLTKKSPYYKLNKSDWVVVVAYSSTVSEGGGRRGVQTVTEKTTLYGTGVEGDARIVQRYVLKPPSTSEERVALAKAFRSGVTENLSDLSNAELHSIHAKWESELHGVNAPPLRLEDICDASLWTPTLRWRPDDGTDLSVGLRAVRRACVAP